MMTKPLKILHAPVNIGNQPWALSRAERELGCESDLIVNYNTWLQYNYDICISKYQDKSIGSLYKRLKYSVLSPFKYNILHYYFGRSLSCWDDYGPRNKFWYLDLKLAKFLGKKIFMTLQGCDVRLAHRSNKNNKFTPCDQSHCQAYNNCVNTYDAERMWFIKKILPLADQVFFLNPELGHFLPRGQFLPYVTIDVENYKTIPPSLNGPIKIVHAPSDPNIKGTKLIVEALNSLKEKYNLELILVTGKTHQEAMNIYQTADIAIDQVLCGWYGAFAVELMAMGKPVMCYLREEDFQFLPPELINDLPFYHISPENLVNNIEIAIQDRLNWLNKSTASREYVFKWHSPKKIASAMVDAYHSKNNEFTLG